MAIDTPLPRFDTVAGAGTTVAAGDVARIERERRPSGTWPPTDAMLEEPVDAEVRAASADRLREIWIQPSGWRYWTAVNNSEVGAWYSLSAFFFMLCAGVLASLMRVQLAVPENDFLSASTYNQFFTMHGSAMMFLFAVPMFEAISILILPALLGARDMPFPRLSAFGFWCFLIGGVFVMSSVLFGIAPDAGWFMYPPLATENSGIGSNIWLLGLSFIEVASIAAAVELIVGVLKCRPPGMRINLMPLYAWYILVVGGMILFAFPPLIAGDFLFELERSLDWPFFDVERGGDPLMWQHLFWIFGHPEVYIIFLPSIAIAAMIVPTVAQRPIVGYSWIVLSAVGTGFLSFGLWVHHMFTTGLPAMSPGFFSAASEAVVIPTGIQLFAFIATLVVGRFVLNVPMLYIAGGLAIFTIGGLTGVMVALAPFDWQVHDSYFIVAHLHYTLFGGMIFPVLAGVYYFYPFFGKARLSERLGRTAFWLLFVGFNLTFLPMHLNGLKGMPRRVYTYPEFVDRDWLNLLSTGGSIVMAAGFVVFTWDLLRPKRDPDMPRNPWRAGTLEWSHDIPDQGWGARSIPFIESRYPLWEQPEIVERMDAARYYLGDAAEMKRETLVTSVLDATPEQCMRVTGPTTITIWAAVFTGGTFILPTFGYYVPAAICAAFALVCVLYWLWSSTAPVPEQEAKDVGLDLRLPIYASGPKSAGWWGMFITMLGDATAFASLVFGYFFFWTRQGEFPPTDVGAALGVPLWLGAGLLVAGWYFTRAAVDRNRRVSTAAARRSLIAAAACTAIGGAAFALSVFGSELVPTAHVYPAMLWALAVWMLVHVFAGFVMQSYCIAAASFGKLTPAHDADLRNIALFHHFLLVTVVVTVLLIGAVPELL